jgi:hypothetical protein
MHGFVEERGRDGAENSQGPAVGCDAEEFSDRAAEASSDAALERETEISWSSLKHGETEDKTSKFQTSNFKKDPAASEVRTMSSNCQKLEARRARA